MERKRAMNDPKKQAVAKTPETKVQEARGGTTREGAILTNPNIQAARVLCVMEPHAKENAREYMDTLAEHNKAVLGGNMKRVESMLFCQAMALQEIFAGFTERAMKQNHAPNLEMFMKMALRAQSQCRATLETLANVKNPPVVIARQANIAAGPQQVNNDLAPARGNQNAPNELSGENHELLSDARTSGKACRVNQTLATVGKVDRAKIARR
jgi:hypothetical protein